MAVVDASFVTAILIDEARSPALLHQLALAREGLHAPELIDLEVLQALRRLSHRGEISSAVCDRALENLAFMRLIRHGHVALRNRIWELRHSMTPYDAAYVALAEMLETRLLTGDRRLSDSHGALAPIVFVG